MRRLVHITILLLFFSAGAMAQARYWVAPGASGNWSDAANWSLSSGGAGGAGAPTSAQTAIFNEGSSASCVLNAAAITVSSLQTTTGYTGTISPGIATSLTAGTITLAGGTFVSPANLTSNNVFRLNGGTYTAGAGTTNFNNAVHITAGVFNAAGRITLTRGLDVATSVATFNPGTSTVVFGGNSSVFVGVNGTAAGTLNFYNLEINKVPPAVNFGLSADDQINVLNDFSLIDGFYRGANSFLNVGGNFTTGPNSDGILANVTLNGANNAIVNINAPVITQNGALFSINKSNAAATVGIVTDLPSNAINISTYTPAVLNIQGGAVNFPDDDDVLFNFATVNIGANASVEASAETMTFVGNFANSGSFTANNGTVVFESNVNRSYSVGTTALNGTTTFYNLILNNTGTDGRFDIQLGDRINVENDLIVQSGYFGVTGGSLTNESFLGVGGDLILEPAAKAFPSALHLQFIGANAQTVTLQGGTTSHINGNVSFVKTDVGPVTLNSPMNLNFVGATVTFTTGILETTATNILTLDGNGVLAAGGNINSYVDGPLIRTGMSAFTFPVGGAGFYAPVHISGTGFNSNYPNATYFVQYFHVNPDGTYPIDEQSPTNPPDLKISEVEYWVVDQLNPTPVTGPRVWLSYESGRSGGVGDPTTIGVTSWTNPGFWQLVGNGGLLNVGGVDFVASAAPNIGTVSQASPVFTLSTIDEIANPLPVTWLSFTGRFYTGTVELNWSTSMELNNEEYTIERSAEGHQYTAIGTVDGVGNTTNISRYNFKDNSPLSGTSYYRIKQTDRDGKFSYSDVIRISSGDVATKSLRIFPNPNSGKLPLTLENGNWTNKKVTVTIYNAVGGIVRQEQLIFGADSRAKVNVDALQKGSYFITTSINNERQTLQFFIQ